MSRSRLTLTVDHLESIVSRVQLLSTTRNLIVSCDSSEYREQFAARVKPSRTHSLLVKITARLLLTRVHDPTNAAKSAHPALRDKSEVQKAAPLSSWYEPRLCQIGPDLATPISQSSPASSNIKGDDLGSLFHMLCSVLFPWGIPEGS